MNIFKRVIDVIACNIVNSDEVFRCAKCDKVYPLSKLGGKQILKSGLISEKSLRYCDKCVEKGDGEE